MEQRFISSAEAAKLLGLSKPMIDKLVGQKAIPSYKIGKRRVFDKEELVEWVKSHKDQSPPPSSARKSAKR